MKWFCDKCVLTYRLAKKSPPEKTKCESPKCNTRRKATYCFKVDR